MSERVKTGNLHQDHLPPNVRHSLAIQACELLDHDAGAHEEEPLYPQKASERQGFAFVVAALEL